jgi:hypothetical protein
MVYKNMQEKKNINLSSRNFGCESYINNDNQHQKDERAYASQGPNSITELVVNGRKARKKIIQFVAIFHLLKHGRPMTEFEHMKDLFDARCQFLQIWKELSMM